ncbi:hypothetical protein EZV62_000532 [Acer yangbiense]|uniref:Xylanase inhibitor C-terminal domain-containing protein n=1 Tax=Acer yangbiense TaxID=1000413 RepID=A0A5C7IRE8_9ROSI|nr:hypothetical protein EZV62_000532 [Acer yangbiense]
MSDSIVPKIDEIRGRINELEQSANDLRDKFTQCTIFGKNNAIQHISREALAWFAMVLWGIWFNRNQMVHNKNGRDSGELVSWAAGGISSSHGSIAINTIHPHIATSAVGHQNVIGGDGASCIDCRKGHPRPGCTRNNCALNSYNPKTSMFTVGGVGEDTMEVYSTDGNFYSGDIFVGGGPYYFINYTGDASKLLIKTPLVINPVSYPRPPLNSKDFSSPEYFIDVKGIKVDGKPVVSFNTSLLSIDNEGKGGTMISTMTYYTVLHSSIYKALVTKFVKEAAAKKMKRVGSVAPFGACFSSENIKNTMTGPAVPIIDPVVKGNNAPWRIYGANSMVKVKKNVLCLGFVDGGSTPITLIILGGHQLENNLVEFDLESSIVGFSSSLLLHNASCSQARIF